MKAPALSLAMFLALAPSPALAQSPWQQARTAFGRGTPRGLQGHRSDPRVVEIALGTLADRVWTGATRLWRILRPIPSALPTSWAVVRAC